MASLAEICTAMANTIANNTATPLITFSYVPDDTKAYPALLVEPQAADFTKVLNRGDDMWTFRVYVLCGSSEPQFAQTQLYGFIDGDGPDSIRRVLFENNTLGLDGVLVFASRVEHVGSFESGGTYATGAVLSVTVHSDTRA